MKKYFYCEKTNIDNPELWYETPEIYFSCNPNHQECQVIVVETNKVGSLKRSEIQK